MSKIYDEILASIIKRKFVENINGEVVAAFRANNILSPTQKHSLLYAIAIWYSRPEDNFNTVVNALGSLKKFAQADFILGATALDKTAHEAFLLDCPEFSANPPESDIKQRIEKLYRVLGLKLISNPSVSISANDATAAAPYLPGQFAAANAASNAASASTTATPTSASAAAPAKAASSGSIVIDMKMPNK